MALSISNTGLALIKKWEGCRLTAYQDSVGVWTIGYGHTSGVKKGQTITQAQADAYLKADCATAEKNVNSFDSKYHWNQNQFDALVSFAFNIGSINQLTANGTRSIATISSKIPAYNKAGGKVLQGLVNRRADEKALFDKAVASDSSGEPTYTVGETYTLKAKRKVYSSYSTTSDPVGYEGLTADGKKHDTDKDGCLDKGTVITCLKVKKKSNGTIWINCPSGWVKGYGSGKTYIS